MKNKIVSIDNVRNYKELEQWLKHLKSLTSEIKVSQVDDLISDIEELLDCKLVATQVMPILEQAKGGIDMKSEHKKILYDWIERIEKKENISKLNELCIDLIKDLRIILKENEIKIDPAEIFAKLFLDLTPMPTDEETWKQYCERKRNTNMKNMSIWDEYFAKKKAKKDNMDHVEVP